MQYKRGGLSESDSRSNGLFGGERRRMGSCEGKWDEDDECHFIQGLRWPVKTRGKLEEVAEETIFGVYFDHGLKQYLLRF